MVTVEDNYGTRWEQIFEFNNDDNGSTGSSVVTPITPKMVTPIGQ